VQRGRAWSFAELEARTRQGAAFLRGQGIGSGDPVLVLLPMGWPLYHALLSVLRAGAVAVFVDPSAGREHLAACCRRIRPVAFIGGPKAQALRWASAPLRAIGRSFAVGGWWPCARTWGAGPAGPEAIAACAPEHPALITFTSGSTGEPKAAVRTHGFLLTQHQVLARSLGHESGQMDLATLPVFVLANLASGRCSLVPDADLRRPGHIRPGPVLAEIARHRPVTTVASPAFLDRLAAGCEAQGTGLAPFQAIHTGGAPVFPGLLARLQALAPGARVVAVYGSTEAEPIAEIAYAEMSAEDLAAMVAGKGLLAGRPVPEIRARVLRDQWGTPLGSLDGAAFAALERPPGQAGEIVVSGDHVLKGYLDGRGDEETKFRVDGEVWHRTGDAGYLDGAGRLWLLGRCSARIADGAGELFPFAVECAAMQVPGVRRAALAALGGRRLLAVEGEAAVADLQRALAWAGLERILPVPAVPMDRRHNAKVDYPRLRRMLEGLRP
jgi:acyl-CoA synthetase (AMP-forming)/AMP-acid ligase II